MSARPPASASRVVAYQPALDGLRGVAVLLILWYHAPFVFRELPPGPFWRWSGSGWIGVDLFFVVSGYLITTILLRTRGAPGQVRHFWIRRGLRILPLAVVYLGLLGTNVHLGDPLGVLAAFPAIAMFLCYLGNVYIAVAGWQPLVVMILWSLAVEEQFYLGWPPVVRMLSRRALAAVCVGLIASAPVWRWIFERTLGEPAPYVLTPGRWDALAWGALVAVVASGSHAARWGRRTALLLPGALLVLAAVVALPLRLAGGAPFPTIVTVLGYSVIDAAFAVVVGWTALAGATNRFGHGPLGLLGRRCYGLYVWHCLVGALLVPWVSAVPFAVKAAVWLAATLAVAEASWRLLEAPMLRLKDRLAPYRG